MDDQRVAQRVLVILIGSSLISLTIFTCLPIRLITGRYPGRAFTYSPPSVVNRPFPKHRSRPVLGDILQLTYHSPTNIFNVRSLTAIHRIESRVRSQPGCRTDQAGNCLLSDSSLNYLFPSRTESAIKFNGEGDLVDISIGPSVMAYMGRCGFFDREFGVDRPQSSTITSLFQFGLPLDGFQDADDRPVQQRELLAAHLTEYIAIIRSVQAPFSVSIEGGHTVARSVVDALIDDQWFLVISYISTVVIVIAMAVVFHLRGAVLLQIVALSMMATILSITPLLVLVRLLGEVRHLTGIMFVWVTIAITAVRVACLISKWISISPFGLDNRRLDERSRVRVVIADDVCRPPIMLVTICSGLSMSSLPEIRHLSFTILLLSPLSAMFAWICSIALLALLDRSFPGFNRKRHEMVRHRWNRLLILINDRKRRARRRRLHKYCRKKDPLNDLLDSLMMLPRIRKVRSDSPIPKPMAMWIGWWQIRHVLISIITLSGLHLVLAYVDRPNTHVAPYPTLSTIELLSHLRRYHRPNCSSCTFQPDHPQLDISSPHRRPISSYSTSDFLAIPGAPQKLMIDVVGPSTVHCVWTRSPIIGASPLRHYLIEYILRPDRQHQIQNVTNPRTRTALIGDLIPGREYEFTIRAVNDHGASLDSQPVLARMLRIGEQLAITSLRAEWDRKSDLIKVSWNRQRGDRIHYRLEMGSTMIGQPFPGNQTVVYTGPDLSKTIRPRGPCLNQYRYRFQIWSVRRNETISGPSDPVHLSPPPRSPLRPPPPKLITQSPTIILLIKRPLCHSERDQIVIWKRCRSEQWPDLSPWIQGVFNRSTDEGEVYEETDTAVEYQYRSQGVNGAGKGDYSQVTTVLAMNAAPIATGCGNCSGRGACVNSVCDCRSGWTGRRCELRDEGAFHQAQDDITMPDIGHSKTETDYDNFDSNYELGKVIGVTVFVGFAMKVMFTARSLTRRNVERMGWMMMISLIMIGTAIEFLWAIDAPAIVALTVVIGAVYDLGVCDHEESVNIERSNSYAKSSVMMAVALSAIPLIMTEIGLCQGFGRVLCICAGLASVLIFIADRIIYFSFVITKTLDHIKINRHHKPNHS